MESPASTRPKYIYKIASSAPPDPIPTVYPLSELDKKDGFIHLSTAAQGRTLTDSSNNIISLTLSLGP